MRKSKTTPQAIVYKSLNKIYTSSRDIAKEWGGSSIPIDMFSQLIEKSRPKESGELKSFNEQYNKLLDSIFDTCVNRASTLGSKSISIKFIKVVIEHVKTFI